MSYSLTKIVKLTYTQAIDKVTEELKKEGFGVLTTIDVRDTLRKKLDVEFGRYVILGACNPPLAHRALLAEEQIGLLLPCNVIVYEKSNTTVVAAFNPMSMTSLAESAALRSVAAEVTSRLERVLSRVS